MAYYHAPKGGLPQQDTPLPTRAKFTTSYAYIPRAVLTDITTSLLPGWHQTRAWILARPMTGFAETFAQSIVEMGAGAEAPNPEPDPEAQAVLFVLKGKIALSFKGQAHLLEAGGYAYLPPGMPWQIKNVEALSTLVWIRKRYEYLDGVTPPAAVITNEQEVAPRYMDKESRLWETKYFVDPTDLAHDMHVNLVGFQPGGIIPFNETHVMEHGIYILEGSAVYRLNQDDYDVRAGDFLWLRAFCPQSCRAFGTRPFRYLLYKDVHRHPSLGLKR